MTQGIQSQFDISLELSGKIIVSWICPRCGYKNKSKIKSADICIGIDFECENNQICGYGNVHFDLYFDVSGYYKDCNDIPLNKEL